MKKTWLAIAGLALASTLGTVAYFGFNQSEASDHDDGDNDLKSRALNLTDHFAFKSPTNPDELSLVMYVNPRSLPGKAYFLAQDTRYEFHVSNAASKTSAPTVADDYVFRFEAQAPDAAGVQAIKLTVLKDGAVVGTHDGASTAYAASLADTITQNDASIGGTTYKYFVGMRADSFHFDVNRFFQVRAYLASRFFGGAGGNGDATAELANNCNNQPFLGGIAVSENDGDNVNLFNPPSCAPDFTKNYNVTAIVLNVPISSLGGTIFDTWSTISVKK